MHSNSCSLHVYVYTYIYKRNIYNYYSRLQFTNVFGHMEHVEFWETVSHAVSSDAYITFQQM